MYGCSALIQHGPTERGQDMLILHEAVAQPEVGTSRAVGGLCPHSSYMPSIYSINTANSCHGILLLLTHYE